MALTYEIIPGPQTRMEVTGVDLDAALRAQLETAWAQSVFDDFLLDEAAQILRSRLARDGYFQPSVDARIAESAGIKTLSVAVERGSRSTTTTVRVEVVTGSDPREMQGGQSPLAEAIVAHLEERGLMASAVSDPGAVEGEVTVWLRMRGHLGARVTAGAPLFEDATATLPLTVEAGPAYVITTVRFDGASSLPDDDLRDAAALDTDAPYDPALVEAARDRLVALDRREGFAAAAVAAQPAVRPDAAAVDVTFAVTEG
jgi:outer membrane protein assembly factor BamA